MKLQNLSIKQKMIFTAMLSSIPSLLAVGMIFLAYEFAVSKTESVHHLSTLVDIIGVNSTAALTFKDNKAAYATLSAVKVEKEITTACIYDNDAKLFSSYVSSLDQLPCPPTPEKTGYYFTHGILIVTHPIYLDSEQIGTIQVYSNLNSLYTRLKANIASTLITILLTGLMAYLLSSQLQSIISKPIFNLAETAKLIAQQKNFSVRAVKTSGDEISYLVDGFNYMLAQIQEQESNLKNQANILRLILDNIGDGVIVVDEHENHLIWNPAADQIMPHPTGKIPVDDITKRYNLYLPDRVTPYTSKESPMARALRGEISNQVEAFMKGDKNHEDAWLSITAAPVKDETGMIRGGVSVIRDITKRKQTEDELRKNQERLQNAIRTREEFLSIAAHELRTPLTPLRLQVQMLLELYKKQKPVLQSPDMLKTMLTSADKQIDRITKLVDNLLDVSRMSGGHFGLQLETTNLSELTTEIIERYKPELTSSNLVISTQIQNSIVVSIDRFRIEQVITNLLTNAMRYGDNKPIHVTLEKTDHLARLIVKDEGIGIAKNDLQRIFGRFERAASASHFGGLGLGLYITKQIIDAHGGEIHIESELHKGSKFIVELPLIPPDERQS